MERSDPRPLGWMKTLETGVPEIDEDHRSFIAQYDALTAMVAERASRSAVAAAVRRMTEHCLRHFVREEAVLIQSQFPRLNEHISAHRHFAAQFYELLDRICRANEANLEHLAFVDAIGELLIELLFRHDLDYKSHLLNWRGE